MDDTGFEPARFPRMEPRKSIRAGILGSRHRRIQTINRLSFFHNPDPVAGDDFNIFAVGFEKLHFSFAACFGELLGGEDAFFLGELIGKRTVAEDFRIEGGCSHSNKSSNDETNHHAVGLVPNLGVLAAF